MRIIEGQSVDLISPFPASEIKRTYGCNHCYRTTVETDDTPNTPEEFQAHMEEVLPRCVTYGIIDKNHLTNDKHPAPLVGIVVFEPVNLRHGYFHVATARKAWRTGLVDEAGQTTIKDIFENLPTLTRVGAYCLEKNFPARGLCKRLGFKMEGVMEDLVVQKGQPVNIVNYGLTRRNWLCQQQPLCPQPSESEGASSEQSEEVRSKEVSNSLENPTPLAA